MAKGSAPAFRWKDWIGPKVCSFCDRALTIEDVGEFRTYVSYDRAGVGRISSRFLWCVDHRGGRS